MQWMVSSNLLSDNQRHVLDECLRKDRKRHWIQGFAGSGKTVLLVHAITQALKENPKLSVCVVVYTHSLKDLVSTGIPDHLSYIPVMTYYKFRNNPSRYDMIVVDEVQDLDEKVLRLLANHCDKLIVAGDDDQSIYEERVSAKDIEHIIAPSIYKLVEMFRLTESIKNIVSTILPNSLIYGARIHRMANVVVTLAHAQNSKQEIEWCWKQARKFAHQGNPAAILLPKHKYVRKLINGICDLNKFDNPQFVKNKKGKIDYEVVNKDLQKVGLNLQYIGNNYGSLAEADHRPMVYVMTYHSVKGLDFDSVFLPNLNKETVFWHKDSEMERRLFFVAMTRSRRNLFMSYHSDQPHQYVKNMPQDLLHIIECKAQKQTEDEKQFFF